MFSKGKVVQFEKNGILWRKRRAEKEISIAEGRGCRTYMASEKVFQQIKSEDIQEGTYIHCRFGEKNLLIAVEPVKLIGIVQKYRHKKYAFVKSDINLQVKMGSGGKVSECKIISSPNNPQNVYFNPLTVELSVKQGDKVSFAIGVSMNRRKNGRKQFSPYLDVLATKLRSFDGKQDTNVIPEQLEISENDKLENFFARRMNSPRQVKQDTKFGRETKLVRENKFCRSKVSSKPSAKPSSQNHKLATKHPTPLANSRFRRPRFFNSKSSTKAEPSTKVEPLEDSRKKLQEPKPEKVFKEKEDAPKVAGADVSKPAFDLPRSTLQSLTMKDKLRKTEEENEKLRLQVKTLLSTTNSGKKELKRTSSAAGLWFPDSPVASRSNSPEPLEDVFYATRHLDLGNEYSRNYSRTPNGLTTPDSGTPRSPTNQRAAGDFLLAGVPSSTRSLPAPSAALPNFYQTQNHNPWSYESRQFDAWNNQEKAFNRGSFYSPPSHDYTADFGQNYSHSQFQTIYPQTNYHDSSEFHGYVENQNQYRSLAGESRNFQGFKENCSSYV